MHFLLTTVVLMALRTSAKPTAPQIGDTFPCSKKGWTYEPTNCFIDSKTYQGELNVAMDGSECLPWTASLTVPMFGYELTDDMFIDGSMAAAGNNCRDPNDMYYPYCFVNMTGSDYPWYSYCEVPQCFDYGIKDDDPCIEPCTCTYMYVDYVDVQCAKNECDNPCYGNLTKDESCCGFCDLTVCPSVHGLQPYYKNGEVTYSDPCMTCTCIADGVNIPQESCVSEVCLGCIGEIEKDGSCCGKCIQGCEYDSAFYVADEEFKHGCYNCKCTVSNETGSVDCIQPGCSLYCHEKMVQFETPGDCCPSCRPGCYVDALDQEFQKDDNIPLYPDDNCVHCTCREYENGTYYGECYEEKCGVCDGPSEDDGSCCGKCHTVGCLVDGVHYEHGDRVPQSDACQDCICNAAPGVSDLMCYQQDCHCPGRREEDGTCCGICTPGCYDDFLMFHEIGIIEDPDPCVTTYCLQGKNELSHETFIETHVEKCEECSGMKEDDGTCCGYCIPGCTHNGIFEFIGQIPSSDPCQEMFCEKDNHIRIDVITCPPCSGERIYEEGDTTCCGICFEGCTYKGKKYESGVTIETVKCDDMYCFEGKIEYKRNQPPCPDCPEGYEHVETDVCCGDCVRLPMEEPTTTVGAPSPDDGLSACDPSKCPQLTCQKSVQFHAKGDCCGQCKCFYMEVGKNGKLYMPGEIVGDKCDGCVCDGNSGKVSCTEPECPANVECVDPVRVDCCFVCPNDPEKPSKKTSTGRKRVNKSSKKTLTGRKQVNKSSKKTSTGGKQVEAQNPPSNVGSQCDPSKCSKLTCPKSWQFQAEGQCCQQCECRKGKDEDGKKKILMPGEMVGDKCDGCVCDGNSGKVSCTEPECPANVECVDPVRVDCCFVCPNGRNCLVRGNGGKAIVLGYGEYYRTKKAVCECGGEPWYPIAFCASVKPYQERFRAFRDYFPKYFLDLGKKNP